MLILQHQLLKKFRQFRSKNKKIKPLKRLLKQPELVGLSNYQKRLGRIQYRHWKTQGKAQALNVEVVEIVEAVQDVEVVAVEAVAAEVIY